MGIEEFINEAGCLHLVQVADALAEAFIGERLNVVLVELVFVDDFQNEVALLVGAFPRGVAIGPGIAVGGSIGRFHPVGVVGNEAGGLDLLIDILLEKAVEAGGFGRHIIGGDQFGFHGDAELVR